MSFSPRNVSNHGEHMCALRQEEKQIAIATEIPTDGLRRGERCYYVAASRHALQQFRKPLGRAGVDVNAALKSGALVEATHDTAHLAGGVFDCEGMLRRLAQLLEDTLAEGLTGLPTCGDMFG